MEANLRWLLVTAIAPVAWGTNYFVTREFLPAGHPLWGATLRAVPAGLLLLAVRRRLPRGPWWWKAAVLGALNVGAFFVLIYLAAQLLPTSVASVVMALSPAVLMVLAWGLVAERPTLLPLCGAVIGVGGVCLMTLSGQAAVNPAGLLASACAMVMSSLGYVLAKRWGDDVDPIASTSWQLLAGGLALLPVAVVVEGAPPALDTGALLGFGYVTVVATALAFAAWFTGLRHLPAGTVGLVGLLNPVTGVLLGATLANEPLTVRQGCGLVLVFGGLLLGRAASGRPPRIPVMADVVVDRLDPSAAADAPLMGTLAAMINEVYATGERGMWLPGFDRTSDAEVAELTRAGRFAVATAAGRAVGCVQVDRLPDDLGEFGMLAADARHQGAGVGGALVRFAEQAARATGCTRMQLELLVPCDWKHPAKEFLASWYGRMGYRLTRVGAVDEFHAGLTPLLATPCAVRVYRKDLHAATG